MVSVSVSDFTFWGLIRPVMTNTVCVPNIFNLKEDLSTIKWLLRLFPVLHIDSLSFPDKRCLILLMYDTPKSQQQDVYVK